MGMAAESQQTDADDRRDKVKSLRRRWKETVAWAKGENLKVGAEKKERLDRVMDEVKALGIPTKAWKYEMTMLDHRDDGEGILSKVQDADDESLLNEFADLTLLAEEGLPLFSEQTVAELEAAAERAQQAREVPDEDDDDKVVPLRQEDIEAGGRFKQL